MAGKIRFNRLARGAGKSFCRKHLGTILGSEYGGNWTMDLPFGAVTLYAAIL
jgi:hypothetical protein